MILVVDDHQPTRDILVKLFHLMEYEAIGVGDGKEALLFLQTHRPRLIILDCAMPCLDGFEVLQAIRANPALASTPVLMFSADPTARERALQLGAREFILKASLGWNKLSDAVGKYLGGPYPRPTRPYG